MPIEKVIVNKIMEEVMKPEKNVYARKNGQEQKIDGPIGESGKNLMFGGGLRGTGLKVPFEYFQGPGGMDEKGEADVPGNREYPANPGEAG